MVTEVKGDLLEMFDNGKFDIICHGCNCQNTLAEGTATGIAKQIGDKYPAAATADSLTVKGDVYKLGRFTTADIPTKGRIFNLYTQYNGGANFEYAALTKCLQNIFDRLVDEAYSRDVRIGFPHIGAGIGGGDWKVIKKLIENELGQFDLTFVKYEKPST